MRMKAIILTALLYTCTTYYAVSSAKLVNWKINRFACLNMTVCETHFCNLTLKSRSEQNLNVGCTLKYPIVDAHVHLKVFYRYNVYKPFLIDIVFDACDYVGPRRTAQNPMMTALMPLFLQYSNFNHSCPIDGELLIRGFILNPEVLQGAHIPSGKYRIEFRVFNKTTDATLVMYKIWATVPASGVTDILAVG